MRTPDQVGQGGPHAPSIPTPTPAVNLRFNIEEWEYLAHAGLPWSGVPLPSALRSSAALALGLARQRAPVPEHRLPVMGLCLRPQWIQLSLLFSISLHFRQKSGQIRHTLVDMSFEHLGSLLIKPHTALRVSCCVVSTEQRRVISRHDPTMLQKPIAGHSVLPCFANTTTCCWPPVPGLCLQRHGQQTVDVSGAGPKQGGIVPAPARWIWRQAEAACGECDLINELLKCSKATP